MLNPDFWHKKKVFITGHTGFKGSWLCLLLSYLGADITGYALQPPTNPSLFQLCNINEMITSVTGDVRNGQKLKDALQSARPEIVIHMAAQPLVRYSYLHPIETFEVNVLGTANLFEAVRSCSDVRAVINVTTDKCYENKEWYYGYRENDSLGGYDPYSNSKACSELVTACYRKSFFNPDKYNEHKAAVASARAGNVIGGGDWAQDRLIADCIKSLLKNEPIIIRNPAAIRPWQHVLEPLTGYLTLAQNLYHDTLSYSEAWNFGPDDKDAKPVSWVVEKLCTMWGKGAAYKIEQAANSPHEANYLKLDCSKARTKLKWQPKWTLNQSMEKIVEWAKTYQSGQSVIDICNKQIEEYLSDEADEKYE